MVSPKLRSLGSRLRRWWGYFPLSLPGAILLSALLAMGYFLGVKQSDHLILISSVALLGAALMVVLAVVCSAAFLSFSFHGQVKRKTFWTYFSSSCPPALWLMLIAAGIFYAGAEHENGLIKNIASIIFVAATLTLLGVLLASLYCSSERSKIDIHTSARMNLLTQTPSPSGRTLPRFLPPLIEASTHILNPPDFDCFWQRNPEKKREEWLVSARRCQLEENFSLLRRVVVKDVLGIASVDWLQEEPKNLVVLPKPLDLKAQSILRARFTGDDVPDPKGQAKGDRVDMRRYAPGDPPRMLLWKVYARTGKLMVRIPEKAITTAPRICAYLVAGPGDESLASLARTIVENDFLGQGWHFGADGSASSVSSAPQALQVIARSGNPGVKTGEGLAAFLREAHTEGFGSCLVLIPPHQGGWVEKLASTLATSPLPLSLLTVGSVVTHKEELPWKKWLFYENESKSEPSELLARLNSSAVTEWLSYEPESGRMIPLRKSS